MSCDRCADQATETVGEAGVPDKEAHAVWARGTPRGTRTVSTYLAALSHVLDKMEQNMAQLSSPINLSAQVELPITLTTAEGRTVKTEVPIVISSSGEVEIDREAVIRRVQDALDENPEAEQESTL